MRLFLPPFALLSLSFLVTEPAFAAIKFKRFPHCPEGTVTVKTCECHAGTSGRYHFCHGKFVRPRYGQVSQVGRLGGCGVGELAERTAAEAKGKKTSRLLATSERATRSGSLAGDIREAANGCCCLGSSCSTAGLLAPDERARRRCSHTNRESG